MTSLASSLSDAALTQTSRVNALAALLGLDEETEEFRAGDLTVKQGSREQRQKDLRWQAEQLMLPYLRDNFLFAGV